jgi:hypothetical protein
MNITCKIPLREALLPEVVPPELDDEFDASELEDEL